MIMTLAFSYAKAQSLMLILFLIPQTLFTSVLIDIVTLVAVKAVARNHKVWAQCRLSFFCVSVFLLSTVLFKTPLASPKRIYYQAPGFTKRTDGVISATKVIVALVLSAVFSFFLFKGYTLIGNMGLVMCTTLALFDTIPIAPMNGKSIYSWNKLIWAALLEVSCVVYVLTIMML